MRHSFAPLREAQTIGSLAEDVRTRQESLRSRVASRKDAKVAKERRGRIQSVLGVVGIGLRRVPEAVGHSGAKVSPLCDLCAFA